MSKQDVCYAYFFEVGHSRTVIQMCQCGCVYPGSPYYYPYQFRPTRYYLTQEAYESTKPPTNYPEQYYFYPYPDPAQQAVPQLRGEYRVGNCLMICQ